MTPLLAYTPFIDPLPTWAHDVWWLLFFPLAFLIAFTYKAVRVADLRRFVAQTLAMTLQIVLGMAAVALGMYLFVEFVALR